MAYKLGKLTGKDRSRIHRWALAYYQHMQEREQADWHFEVKRLLHLILRGVNNKLHEAAFPEIEVEDPDVIPGHTYGVDDLPDLERILRKLDQMGTKTQTELNKSEWTDWG